MMSMYFLLELLEKIRFWSTKLNVLNIYIQMQKNMA